MQGSKRDIDVKNRLWTMWEKVRVGWFERTELKQHRVKVSVPGDFPLPPPNSHAPCKVRCFWTCASEQMAINQRFPGAPSSGLINLAEELTELRGALFHCITGLLWKVKLRKSQMEATHRGRCRRGCGASMHSLVTRVPAPPRVHQHRRSPTFAILEFLQRLHHVSIINH